MEHYCPHCDQLLVSKHAPSDDLEYHAERPLMHLSGAIACGDLADARHWLEQVAAILGEAAQTEIDTGRITPNLARGPGTTR